MAKSLQQVKIKLPQATTQPPMQKSPPSETPAKNQAHFSQMTATYTQVANPAPCAQELFTGHVPKEYSTPTPKKTQQKSTSMTTSSTKNQNQKTTQKDQYPLNKFSEMKPLKPSKNGKPQNSKKNTKKHSLKGMICQATERCVAHLKKETQNLQTRIKIPSIKRGRFAQANHGRVSPSQKPNKP